MRVEILTSKVALVSAAVLTAAAVSAGPVTTVPWNGYTGAASFTYDDARPGQLPNLVPQLDSLGIKATFFIAVTGAGGNFATRFADYVQLAKQGHEVTNHTWHHNNVTNTNADTLIRNMATYLRGLDPAVPSLTFAYPNCNIPGTAGKEGVSAENFVARGCANTSYAWGTQPSDWMNIQGLIMQPTNQSAGTTLLNNARNQNRWAILVIHDVTANPDAYSLTPANNRQLLNTAVTNGMWVDTYERIAAYYRAHFTLDTAQAVQAGDAKRVEWGIPHARMPASVPLRVRLDSTVFGDSAVVVQDSAEIPLQADGSYIVDFMKRRMDVYPKGTVAVHPHAKFRRAHPEARVSGRVLRLSGLPEGAYVVELHTVTGKLHERGVARIGRSGTQAFALRSPARPGLHQVTLRPQGGTDVRRLPVLVLE